MAVTQNKVEEDPQVISQPASPVQDSSAGESVSVQSTKSRGTMPKHTISHDEVGLVQAGSGPSILTENDCPEALAYAWPKWKKWGTLTIIFLVQISMNLNASLYANGQSGIVKDLGVSSQAAVSGAAVFLVLYAFGCELWAPWSEEFGRKPVLQYSLLMVNLCCLPVGFANIHRSFIGILIGRAFGGLFSAGGSVTLGVVADMFIADEQELPLAFIVLSSVGGSIIGPIIGGFIEQNLYWTWTIWIQLFFGLFVQILHLAYVPETRSAILVNRHAKKMRKDKFEATGESSNVFGPFELKPFTDYLIPKEVFAIWTRPFQMLYKEKIVLVLSLLSGFSDALIFMQIQSLRLVFERWDFTDIQIGLAFIPFGLAYVLAYLLYIPSIYRNRALRVKNPLSEHAQYESRLWWLLFTAPLLPIGLLIFAWTSTRTVHWIAPMIGCLLIGIANYTIYMTTIDYMVKAYGPYSASATGGNGFARDFLAGVLTWAAAPYYDAFDFQYGLQVANTVLAGVGLILVVATFVIYYKGPSMRKRSPFAESIRGDAPLEVSPSTIA
ncbi:MFS general substrate transporter [Daldinia vernicosa]|uniref:MFS general substrate transporter n=1 Tax=Daldinia vernicosa TaxID=114800 RepID=UPI0020079D51|nr:MFS general substrate transporter [Daldinia vernicosa]KAI0850670.1 MFS general substrate transporter [Daldinia vernicosa]